MKVLMVITSHDQLGNTGRKTGFWLEELAKYLGRAPEARECRAIDQRWMIRKGQRRHIPGE